MKFGDLLKQAKDSGAMGDAVIPDGDFLLEVINTNCKDPEEGPIGLQLAVLGGEDGPLPEDDPAAKAKTWINLYFSEKAAPISFRQLKDLGFDEDFLANSDSAEAIAEAAKGIKFTASVGHRNWGDNGERCNNTLKGVTVVVGPAVGLDPQSSDEDPEEPF